MIDNKYVHRALLFFIFVYVSILYYPSLFHIPRSDHLLYLAHIARQEGWFSLAFSNFDYERTASFVLKKDMLLFRPMIFLFLGTEKWLFGYNFICWQLTGIILHLLVIWQLIELLLDIRRSKWAYALALFFATIFAHSEMIIWHHINSYILVAFCHLVMLRIILKRSKGGELKAFDSIKLGIALIVCCFTFEFGFLSALLFLATFYYVDRRYSKDKNKKKTHFWIFSSIPFVYLFSNVINYLTNWSPQGSVQPNPLRSFDIFQTIKNTFIAFGWWTMSGLCPFAVSTKVYQRTAFFPSFYTHLNVFFVLGICVGITLCLLVLKKRKQEEDFISGIRTLLLVLIVVYGVLLSVGRLNRGVVYKLSSGAYYAYYYWLYLTVFIYSFLNASKNGKKKCWKSFKYFIIVIVYTIVVANSSKTFRLNKKIARKTVFLRSVIVKVEELMRERSPDKELSFSISVPCLNLGVPWVKLPGDEKKEIKYIELLYPQYYDEDDPLYSLILSEGVGLAWEKNR